MRFRRRHVLWLAGLLTCLAVAPSLAAEGGIAPRSCVVDTDSGDPGPCATAPGLGAAAYLAVSPDGRHVYVTARASAAITTFKRDRRTGGLTRAPGRAACVAWSGSSRAPGDCVKVPGLNRPAAIVLSRDGRFAYVSGEFGDSVAAFRRDRRTGRLVPLGCLSGPSVTRDPGCAPLPTLDAPIGLALSPDDRFLYVSSSGTSGIVILRRDATRGSLDFSGCVEPLDKPGCARTTGTGGLDWVALSPDGSNLYASSSSSNSVAAFARDRGGGGLTFLNCLSGVSTLLARDAACGPGRGMQNVQQVLVSRDGRHVYASATDQEAIVIFARAPASGEISQLPDVDGCITDVAEGAELCQLGLGLADPFGLAFDPTGSDLYVGSFQQGAVGALRRDPASGLLTRISPCYAASDPSCATLDRMARAGYLEVSPDGRHLYLNAPDANAVHVFAREAVPPVVKLRGHALRLRAGPAVAPTLTCLRSAALGCFGDVVVRVLGGRGRPIGPVMRTAYDLRPGRRARVRIKLHPRAIAILRTTAPDILQVSTISREPAGSARTLVRWVRVRPDLS